MLVRFWPVNRPLCPSPRLQGKKKKKMSASRDQMTQVVVTRRRLFIKITWWLLVLVTVTVTATATATATDCHCHGFCHTPRPFLPLPVPLLQLNFRSCFFLEARLSPFLPCHLSLIRRVVSQRTPYSNYATKPAIISALRAGLTICRRPSLIFFCWLRLHLHNCPTQYGPECLCSLLQHLSCACANLPFGHRDNAVQD